MADFNEALRENIEKSGYSITSFAQKCNINRSWLSNVLSGKKNLSKAKFENIIDSGVFNASQVETLKSLYSKKNFSDDEIKRIKHIISLVERKTRRNECIVPIEVDEEKRMHFGKLSVLSLIYNMLSNSDDISFVYANIPATSEEAMDMLYHFMSLDCNKNKDYKHIFFTDDGEDTRNISTFFTMSNLAELGYTNISVIENVDIDSMETGNLFSYFLITDKMLILFDSLFNNAVVTTDEDIINIHIQKFMKLYDSGVKSVFRCNNAVDLMRVFTTFHDDIPELCFTPYFCVTPLLDYDVLSKNAAPDLPNKEALIQAVINHYNVDFSRYSNFLDMDSLNHFASSGRIHEIPQKYLLPINVEGRIKILKKIKANFECKEHFESLMFNPVKLKYNSYDMQIERNGTVNVCGFLFGNEDKAESFVGEWFCLIKNREFYNDLLNLKDYLIENSYIYNNDFAETYVENIIKELEAQVRGGRR